VACKQEYDYRHKYIHVVEEGPKKVEGKLTFSFRAHVCQHCDDPPCAEVCPEDAITKREDGIVVLDHQECNGCELCIEECDYDALTFDREEQTMLKCNLCHHRVDRGLIPACADNVCLAHCIYFGDPHEIESAIKSRRKKAGLD
jgi:Fe-S-cluster-containing dehydrogenase component